MYDKEMITEIGNNFLEMITKKLVGGIADSKAIPEHPLRGLTGAQQNVQELYQKLAIENPGTIFPDIAALMNISNSGRASYEAKILADYETAVREGNFELAGGIAAVNYSIVTPEKMAKVAQTAAKLSKGLGNPLSQNNLSTYIFHNFPVEQPPVFGLYPPAPIFHPEQDPQLPFFYNPVEDSYLGFRWDYGDVGPIIPPLTKDMIGRYSGL